MKPDNTRSKARLDRFISQNTSLNKRDVRLVLAQKRVVVDGIIASDTQQTIHPFTTVTLDNKILQKKERCYLMMNKPIGVVSATRDHQHKTVIDLLDHLLKESLHIAGRLDLNSSGLLLLTNDSVWSRKIMQPEQKTNKVYHVTTKDPITTDYITAFNNGMEFPYEGITTKPAKLKILDSHSAEVSLTEGKYHQIKRMFGRFRNQVLTIHRLSIGAIELDTSLAQGETRELSSNEINYVT